jgi:hypothetical protein
MTSRSNSSEGFLASSFPLESLDVQEKEAAPSDDDDYGLFIEEMDPAKHDGATVPQVVALTTQCLDTQQQETPPSDDDYGLCIEQLVPVGEDDANYPFVPSGDNDYGQFTEEFVPKKQELTAAEGLSEGLSPHQPRRPSIKMVSTYGAMEKLGKNIPISLKRNAFKVLPALSMKKSESLASFFHGGTTEEPIKKSVSFHNIYVRDYDQTIGDNPSCSCGTPVSLDWNYEENEALNIDIYEGNRLRRRSLRDMHVNYYQRKHLLSLRHSEEEIKEGKKAAEKIKFQRSVTNHLISLMKLEDILESAARKVKRVLKKKGTTKFSSMPKKCLSTGNLVLDDDSNITHRSMASRKTV